METRSLKEGEEEKKKGNSVKLGNKPRFYFKKMREKAQWKDRGIEIEDVRPFVRSVAFCSALCEAEEAKRKRKRKGTTFHGRKGGTSSIGFFFLFFCFDFFFFQFFFRSVRPASSARPLSSASTATFFLTEVRFFIFFSFPKKKQTNKGVAIVLFCFLFGDGRRVPVRAPRLSRLRREPQRRHQLWGEAWKPGKNPVKPSKTRSDSVKLISTRWNKEKTLGKKT